MDPLDISNVADGTSSSKIQKQLITSFKQETFMDTAIKSEQQNTYEVDGEVSIKMEINIPHEVYVKSETADTVLEETEENPYNTSSFSETEIYSVMEHNTQVMVDRSETSDPIFLPTTFCKTNSSPPHLKHSDVKKCEPVESSKNFEQHNICDGECSFHCNHCEKNFKKKNSLYKHLSRVHKKRKEILHEENRQQFCDLDHPNMFDIGRGKNKQFSCTVCDKEFSSSNNLNQHFRIHTCEKPFSCSICDKKFRYGGDFVKHKRIHTGERPFACNVCSKTFFASGGLSRHTRLHTGEKPFSCSECDKKFSHSSNLNKHMRIHTGEKPFSSSVCDKKFTNSGNHVKHMRTHTGHKPFSCNMCDMKFTNSSSLVIHIRCHTNEKPFSCNICGRKFSDAGNLTKHSSVHSVDQPFSCSVCSKKYKTASNLAKHMKVHLNDKLNACVS